jgi:hypothetical protein
MQYFDQPEVVRFIAVRAGNAAKFRRGGAKTHGTETYKRLEL